LTDTPVREEIHLEHHNKKNASKTGANKKAASQINTKGSKAKKVAENSTLEHPGNNSGELQRRRKVL
jgi:hypothetical protein